MIRIIVSIVIMATLVLADGPVLQTGQVLSYNQNGDIVTDGSSKDDGFYQKGATHSYSRNGDILIDNITGLQWQDNESITKPWVTQEYYDMGNYDNTSGDTAATYCSELTLGGFLDWRLPKLKELQTLIDYTGTFPSTREILFHHIAVYGSYWSTIVKNDSPNNAWFLNFLRGSTSYDEKSISEFYVRCVRGEQLKPSEFYRSCDSVYDHTTGLQWQDINLAGQPDWGQALGYCEDLLLDYKSDWRTPNQNELLSITNYITADISLDSIFQERVSEHYWSSTTDSVYANWAWEVDFSSGSSNDAYKSNVLYYIRCVRGDSNYSHFLCPCEEYPIQGTEVCTQGTSNFDPIIYPDDPCAGVGQQRQGSSECNTNALPEEPVSPYPLLISCSPGQMRVQGVGCMVSSKCIDMDGDGFYGRSNCGTVVDCNDSNPDINPNQAEICSGIDDNCDGQIDIDAIDRQTFYRDKDGDGYGSSGNNVQACQLPQGYVDNSEDLTDGDPDINICLIPHVSSVHPPTISFDYVGYVTLNGSNFTNTSDVVIGGRTSTATSADNNGTSLRFFINNQAWELPSRTYELSVGYYGGMCGHYRTGYLTISD